MLFYNSSYKLLALRKSNKMIRKTKEKSPSSIASHASTRRQHQVNKLHTKHSNQTNPLAQLFKFTKEIRTQSRKIFEQNPSSLPYLKIVETA